MRRPSLYHRFWRIKTVPALKGLTSSSAAQCCFNVGPASKTVGQHLNSIRFISTRDRTSIGSTVVLLGVLDWWKIRPFNKKYHVTAERKRGVTSAQCWDDISDVGPALSWRNASTGFFAVLWTVTTYQGSVAIWTEFYDSFRLQWCEKERSEHAKKCRS